MLFLIPIVVLLNLAFSNPFSGESTFVDQEGLTETYLVKGKVTAEDTGKPLPGVNIIIKDTYTGTITDINGEFSLEVKEENIMLSVSFMGYETLVVKAKKDEFLNIVLKRKTGKEELEYPEKEPVTQLGLIDAGLYIIDGKEVTKEEAAKLQQHYENIQSISVLMKETAVEKYGEKGKNGVMIFTTNENKELSSLYQSKPLYFVNEKEITDEKFKQMNPENIQSLTVLKGGSALKVYGERAKDGVIIITLKDYISTNSNQNFFVKGKVLDDSTGEPLPGASIIISNTYTGTITDKNGEFSLQADNENISFTVSYIGFKTVTVKVIDNKYLEIRLKRDVYKLRLEQPKPKANKEPVKSDKPVEKNLDESFVIVEDVPHFPGGNQALQEYLASNIHYPKKAEEEGISGTVWVRFTVEKSGKIKNVMLDKKLYPPLDKEALRVISSMPEWEPGTQRGKAVPVELLIPVEFKLLIDEVPARKILK